MIPPLWGIKRSGRVFSTHPPSFSGYLCLCSSRRGRERRNPKLEEIRANQRQRIAKKSEQRKAAALRRWHPEECDRNAAASNPHMREGMQNDAHHPPPTTHPLEKERAAREGSFPTLDQVKGYAPTVMASPECAERFWNDCEATVTPVTPVTHAVTEAPLPPPVAGIPTTF